MYFVPHNLAMMSVGGTFRKRDSNPMKKICWPSTSRIYRILGMLVYNLFIEFVGVTLFNKIILVSVTQFYMAVILEESVP